MNIHIANLARYIKSDPDSWDPSSDIITLFHEVLGSYSENELLRILCTEWEKSLTRKNKLSILREARERYKMHATYGMCDSIKAATKKPPQSGVMEYSSTEYLSGVQSQVSGSKI